MKTWWYFKDDEGIKVFVYVEDEEVSKLYTKPQDKRKFLDSKRPFEQSIYCNFKGVILARQYVFKWNTPEQKRFFEELNLTEEHRDKEERKPREEREDSQELSA